MTAKTAPASEDDQINRQKRLQDLEAKAVAEVRT